MSIYVIDERAKRYLLASPRWFETVEDGDCGSCGRRYAAGTPLRNCGGWYRAACCASPAERGDP